MVSGCSGVKRLWLLAGDPATTITNIIAPQYIMYDNIRTFGPGYTSSGSIVSTGITRTSSGLTENGVERARIPHVLSKCPLAAPAVNSWRALRPRCNGLSAGEICGRQAFCVALAQKHIFGECP